MRTSPWYVVWLQTNVCSPSGHAPCVTCMLGNSSFAPLPFLALLQGLAHCYEKGDDGHVVDRFLIEPVSANSLESMVAGAKTCFKYVCSVTLSQALTRSKASLPAEFADGLFCEEFETRCDSCARTWLRPHAMDNLL